MPRPFFFRHRQRALESLFFSFFFQQAFQRGKVVVVVSFPFPHGFRFIQREDTSPFPDALKSALGHFFFFLLFQAERWRGRRRKDPLFSSRPYRRGKLRTPPFPPRLRKMGASPSLSQGEFHAAVLSPFKESRLSPQFSIAQFFLLRREGLCTLSIFFVAQIVPLQLSSSFRNRVLFRKSSFPLLLVRAREYPRCLFFFSVFWSPFRHETRSGIYSLLFPPAGLFPLLDGIGEAPCVLLPPPAYLLFLPSP